MQKETGENELAARPATPQPTLKGAAYRLLGAICKHFPKQTSKKHGQEARIKSALMSELRIQVESTAQKLDLSVVEGCLKGNFNTGSKSFQNMSLEQAYFTRVRQTAFFTLPKP